ncbi:MAG TPA: 3-hydroxyacyl-CoA dehydrogenase family protein [Flavisolibacter sp.]|nr:3-hydroxyacyl-CoA dehydrogenase family protein [Flavisolibacter sp.]
MTVFRVMQIVVVTDDLLKEELLADGVLAGARVEWISEIEELNKYPNAEACIDLLFTPTGERIQLLQQKDIVIINSVEYTLTETHQDFVRINGWNTFLKSATIEASAGTANRAKAENVFDCFHKKISWLPDTPGFVTPRVVSMMINEAYMALQDGVSTMDEIDIAMKLGTNYPYGPFEWAEKIGREKITALLEKLSLQNPLYTPASSL